MKKNIKILLTSTALFSLATATFVYATNSSISQDKVSATPKAVSSASISKSTEIFSELNSSSEKINSQVTHDDMQNKDFYSIENSKYLINLDTDNNLAGIYSKTISSTSEVSTADKTTPQNYIVNKYKELNLPSTYELNYLEKFDDLIWQANFEKNYNGIYNKYESVKVFFIPDSDEIVSLTVFNEGATSSTVNTSKEDAESTAVQNLGINSSDIVSANLSMEKANKFYDNNNADTSVHPTWVIQSSDNSLIYVDAESNKVIGGDSINE